jgi:hypothetical protein
MDRRAGDIARARRATLPPRGVTYLIVIPALDILLWID